MEIEMTSIRKEKRKYNYPYKPKPGEKRFVLRLPDDIYTILLLQSRLEGQSLNQAVIKAIRESANKPA